MVSRVLENMLLGLSGFVFGVVIAATFIRPEETVRDDIQTIDWLLRPDMAKNGDLIELRYVTFDEVEKFL